MAKLRFGEYNSILHPLFLVSFYLPASLSQSCAALCDHWHCVCVKKKTVWHMFGGGSCKYITQQQYRTPSDLLLPKIAQTLQPEKFFKKKSRTHKLVMSIRVHL
jgi:hypothetical protein